MQQQKCLERIEHIGQSFAASGHGLALIGLGSTGQEHARADEFSDLDFFAVVEQGHKERYLNELNWLSEVAPICWKFRHTSDGVKLWFDDALFCKFSVFEPNELSAVSFAPGKIVWKRADVATNVAISNQPVPRVVPHNIEWAVGEALSHVHVGMSRYLRGEKLSAFRMVQVEAMQHVLELIERSVDVAFGSRDPFAIERRFETRFPDFAPLLNGMMMGYTDTPLAAEHIVRFIEERWPVPDVVVQTILHQVREAIGHSLR